MMVTAILATLTKGTLIPEIFESLDLEPIKYKLMNLHDKSKAWSLEKCDQVADQYRMFLVLCKLYPTNGIVPTHNIDEFWHQHILDTLKYVSDCQKLFGYFLHHYPYFGLRGAEDAQALVDSFEKTRALFIEQFNYELCLDNEAESCRDDCVSLRVGDNIIRSKASDCLDSGECTFCTNSCTPNVDVIDRPRPIR